MFGWFVWLVCWVYLIVCVVFEVFVSLCGFLLVVFHYSLVQEENEAPSKSHVEG